MKNSNLFVTPVKNSCDFFTIVTNTCESFTSVKDSHEFFTSVIRTHDMCDKVIKKSICNAFIFTYAYHPFLGNFTKSDPGTKRQICRQTGFYFLYLHNLALGRTQ